MTQHEEDKSRLVLNPSTLTTEVDFSVKPEECEKLIECIRRTGKITIRLEDMGITKLPEDFRRAVVAID